MASKEFIAQYVAFINQAKQGIECAFVGKPEDVLVRDLMKCYGDDLNANNAQSMRIFIMPEIQAYFEKRGGFINQPALTAMMENCIETLGAAGYLRKKSQYVV